MSKSKYDPFWHHRRSTRYAGWDYRTPGYYFITICTHEYQLIFENPIFRQIAEDKWRLISQYKKAKHVALDEWVVMPNHIHGIIWIQTWPEDVVNDLAKREGFENVQAGSIGAIIGNYKAQVTRRINSIRGQQGGKVWLRGYWDRIVRDEDELNRIRQYIKDNPHRWQEDRDDLDKILSKMIFHHS